MENEWIAALIVATVVFFMIAVTYTVQRVRQKIDESIKRKEELNNVILTIKERWKLGK